MSLEELRASGLLELYIYGGLSEEEEVLIMDALDKYPALKQDLEEIELVLSLYAQSHAIQPHGAVKPLLLASIDYLQRLQNGEAPSRPPMLHEYSIVADFRQWLDREDMQTPTKMEDMHARIIAQEPEKTTAIVWLKYGAPGETHTNEYEKFLIVEGTCTITIGEKKHSLKPGDYLSIPLHVNHDVKVTSVIPCKIILQRVAVA